MSVTQHCFQQQSDFLAAALEVSSGAGSGAAALAEKHATEQAEVARLRLEAREAAERAQRATDALLEAEVSFFIFFSFLNLANGFPAATSSFLFSSSFISFIVRFCGFVFRLSFTRSLHLFPHKMQPSSRLPL